MLCQFRDTKKSGIKTEEMRAAARFFTINANWEAHSIWTHIFNGDGFQCKGLWGVRVCMTYYGLVSPPFLTPEELFCAQAVKVFLTPKMRNM